MRWGFHELAEGQTALRATISLLKDREDDPIGPTQFTVVAGTVTSTEFVIPLTEKIPEVCIAIQPYIKVSYVNPLSGSRLRQGTSHREHIEPHKDSTFLRLKNTVIRPDDVRTETIKLVSASETSDEAALTTVRRDDNIHTMLETLLSLKQESRRASTLYQLSRIALRSLRTLK